MIGQMKIRAYKDNILCINGDFGDKTTRAGIIVKSTIGSDEGIAPRWFQVFEVGPDVTTVQAGQWVYVEYGQWTEGVRMEDDRLDEKQLVWKINPVAMMLVTDEQPNEHATNLGNLTTFRPDTNWKMDGV
jgi:hypothetical protein